MSYILVQLHDKHCDLLHCSTSVVAEVDEDLLQLDVIAHHKGKVMPKSV